jgi:putative peptide zinc metalloprotease protein
MTSTLDPSARTAPAALGRAEGIELLGELHGSGYRAGAALVRRADGQMVQLGPLMYALLDEVDGRRTNSELARALCERLGRGCDEEHVVQLAEKLAAQGLLAGTEQNAPPRRNPLLALRFKMVVTSPRATRLLSAPFAFLFHPWIVWPVAACFALVTAWLLLLEGVGSATADAFDKPALLLLVFALAVASAGFHELGHAAACRYGGATPGAMGMGLYLVWPAFYTDVTDAYRLPRRDRLRVDLGGVYFNALVAVATAGVWLAWRRDGLLLLIALQLLMIVKNLSPVLRSDGYHVLADATGIPDLYAHLGPTLRRLLFWRKPEQSALRGRARLLVTLWVLVVVPVLLSMMVGAVLMLPRLAATAWDSGRVRAAPMPHELAGGHPLAFLASLLELVALVLPLAGSAFVAQRLGRMLAGRVRGWSEGSAPRQWAVVGASAAVACAAAWAWWPSGQYQAVRPTDHATLLSFGRAVASPASFARPAPAAPSSPPATRVHLAPGRHLAVAMIPLGGATKAHPALFVIPAKDGDPAIAIVTAASPDPGAAATPTAAETTTPVRVNAFPFRLPAPPGPGDTQAVAVNRTDGGVVYDIAYALVTVSGGKPVTNANSAFAFANCRACTTVAVSFQVVLVIGRSDRIAPINAAGAENGDCPACTTTAIADQIVVTLTSQPSQALVDEIVTALKKLDALPALGAAGTPAAVAAQVAAVQKEIDDAIAASGQAAGSQAPPATTAGTSTRSTTTTTASTVATSSTAATATTAPGTTTAPASTTAATTTAPAPATTTAPTTTAETTTAAAATTTAPETTTAETTTTAQPTTTTAG